MHNPSSRLKKAKLNILWSAIYQVVNFVCKMILPPMIILTYGSAYNGMVASITQFLSVVGFLRLGVAGAFRVALYKPLAENDVERVSAVVKGTERYLQKIGFIIVAYVLLLTIAYPKLIVPEYNFWDVAALVLAIGLCTFAEDFFGITYTQLLSAGQKLYISNALRTLLAIMTTALSVALIYGGFSLQTVKMLGALLFLAHVIFLKVYVSREYKIRSDAVPDPNALGARWGAMWHSIANIVHENTDVLALTLLTDVRIVSVYSVYRAVCSGIGSILSIGTTGLEAAFGEMWAKGQTESVQRNLRLLEYAISGFVSIVLTAAGLMILPFVSLYVRGARDVEYVVPLYAAVIMAAYALYCFEVPYRLVIQAAGHYRETKQGRLWQSAINLGLTMALVLPFGLVGTALGTMAANAFGAAQYFWYTSRKLVRIPIFEGIKRMAWTAANVGCTCLVCMEYVQRLAYEDWRHWAMCSAACLGVSGVVFVASSLCFYREDLGHIIKLLRRNRP